MSSLLPEETAFPDDYRKLLSILRRYGRVAVAFSGGVDSTFLLFAACAALGPEKVRAFHARSGLIPAAEARKAGSILATFPCARRIFTLDPLSWPEFAANPPDRCYHCKKKIYQPFVAAAQEDGGSVLLDGTNTDDLQEVRPGRRALEELRVRLPLVEAGLAKKDIRRLSRDFGLPTWNAFSASCLATRIASGEPVTREKIFLVDRCEEFLAAQGFSGVRVRLSGRRATIEVLASDLDAVMKKNVFSMICDHFCRLGLHGAEVNPKGRPLPVLG